MLLCVPDPVWKTTSGNSPSHLPSITSCAARTISAALSPGIWPSSPLANAARADHRPSPAESRRPDRKIQQTPLRLGAPQALARNRHAAERIVLDAVSV